MSSAAEPRVFYRRHEFVERHVPIQAELQGLAAEYAQRSETCGIPAILATLRTADDLVDAVA